MANASTILSIFSLIFWSFQLAPQAFLHYRQQSTVGVSPWLFLSWSVGSAFTGANNVATSLGPLFLIQPNLFLVFSIICYTQCYYYPTVPNCAPGPVCVPAVSESSSVSAIASSPDLTPPQGSSPTLNGDTRSPSSNRPNLLSATLHFLFILLLSLSIELAVSLSFLHYGITSASQGGLVAVNVLALLGFLLGFVPQYAVIWRRRCVEGISLIFLAIDMTGATLSTLALAFTGDFAVVEAANYIGVFVLDAGIVILSFLLPPNATNSQLPIAQLKTPSQPLKSQSGQPFSEPFPKPD